MLLQDITDAALSGLAVDPDYVRVVAAADIRRINGKIGNGPQIRILFLPVFHALGNGILMRTGESGKYQRAAVRTSLIHLHAGVLLIFLAHIRHIVKVQSGVHTLGIHIHGQSHNIHISGPLAVSEKGALDPVRSGQYAHLRV